MEGFDRFVGSTSVYEVSGRFVETEEDDPGDEHGECLKKLLGGGESHGKKVCVCVP